MIPFRMIITAANTVSERDLDQRHRQRQHQRAERFTDTVGDHFRMMDRGEHACRERRGDETPDDAAEPVANPGRKQYACSQDRGGYGPGRNSETRFQGFGYSGSYRGKFAMGDQ